MTEDQAKRKLTAILSADVKGYSRLMADDEEATVRTINTYREVMTSLIKGHRGRVVDAKGDNVLAEFSSVVDAVRCAVQVQKELKERNSELPEYRRMEFRIGINLGDVIEGQRTIYGDGVNVAARLEGLAEGGGICISGTAFDHVKNRISVGYAYQGKQSVKNIPDPVRVYKVLLEPDAAGKVIGEEEPRPRKKRWAAISAVAVLALVAAGLFWNFHLRRPPIEPASVERMAYPLPEKPSIAVLPFVNMTADPKQEYIADGITENIITALSKVPEVFVIARNSVFTYKGKPVKIKRVSEELGVQYVLEGSIQQSDSRLRITAQLIDATGGHHIWAERFDRDLDDIFILQDEVTLDILSALRLEFTHGEQARVQETTNSLEAWSCLVQGLSHFESFTKNDNARAQELFERAVEVDSKYSYAWAMLGWTHWIDAAFGYSDSSSKSFKKAVEIAQKAVELDDKQPDVHALLGGIYLFQRQYDQAIAEGQRSIKLGPNIACNRAILARTMLFAGRFEEAIKLTKSAMRLNPHYPSWYLESLAMAYGVIGEHEKAIASYKKLLRDRRNARGNILTPLLGLAANSIILGREDEARSYAGEVLEVNPDFSLEWFQKLNIFRNPSHLTPFIDALHKAGLPETPFLRLPEKSSIAVLPFENMSGDPEQEYFSDGITEEIITALSKTPKLFVIARNSSFTYKGKPVKVQQIGRELGVKYVLEGSVRKARDKVRITAKLVDAKTGNHLWADRYDRDLKDIFAIQDEITMKIMSALQVTLTEGEQARVYGKGTDNLEAYLKVLQAREHFFRMNKQGSMLARELAKEAIELDAGYGTPHVILSLTYMMDLWFKFTESPKESMKLAVEAAEKALALDDSNPSTYVGLCMLYIMQRQHDKAIAAAERAVALSPSGAMAYHSLGTALNFAGRQEEAIVFFKKAISLNPFPPSTYSRSLGNAYRMAGHYEEAITEYKKTLQQNPDDLFAHLGLAVTYIFLGREDKARAEATEVLRIHPRFSLEHHSHTLPFKNKADTKLYIDALRKAGLK